MKLQTNDSAILRRKMGLYSTADLCAYIDMAKIQNLKIIKAASLILGLASIAWGCSFDTDCAVGSHCAKTPNQMYGVCLGGMYQGNQNDMRPVYQPQSPTPGYGNECHWDTDCGPGNHCEKKNSYDMVGVCMNGIPTPPTPAGFIPNNASNASLSGTLVPDSDLNAPQIANHPIRWDALPPNYSASQVTYIRAQAPMAGFFPWLFGKITGKVPMQYIGRPIAVVNINPYSEMAKQLGLPPIFSIGRDKGGNLLYMKSDVDNQRAQIVNILVAQAGTM